MSASRRDVVEKMLETRARWARHELDVVDVLKLEEELGVTEEERAEVRRLEAAAHLRPHLRVVKDEDDV